jgi:hypothetical protein
MVNTSERYMGLLAASSPVSPAMDHFRPLTEGRVISCKKSMLKKDSSIAVLNAMFCERN